MFLVGNAPPPLPPVMNQAQILPIILMTLFLKKLIN